MENLSKLKDLNTQALKEKETLFLKGKFQKIGWFMLVFVGLILAIYSWKKYGFKKAEGLTIIFFTLGGYGVLLWFVWNYLIFGDPLYFIFGPYSAHSQQESFAAAGLLQTEEKNQGQILSWLAKLVSRDR